MYSEGARQRIRDMLEAIGRIRQYVAGMNFEAFLQDPKTVDAVVRNLEIIGEASRHVPPDLAEVYTDAEWTRISDMRNKLIHDYARTNERLVWETVQLRLGPLAEALEAMADKTESAKSGK